MNNRNLIIYGFITFMVFIVVYLVYMAFFQKSQDNKIIQIIPTIRPFPTFMVSPTIYRVGFSDKITASGILMDNFYRNGHVLLGNQDIIIRENADYRLVYFARGDYFLLSINNTPFEKTRKKSEKELLRILNINENDACSLKIRIITPRWVNPDFAYTDYPFSFCR